MPKAIFCDGQNESVIIDYHVNIWHIYIKAE